MKFNQETRVNGRPVKNMIIIYTGHLNMMVIDGSVHSFHPKIKEETIKGFRDLYYNYTLNVVEISEDQYRQIIDLDSEVIEPKLPLNLNIGRADSKKSILVERRELSNKWQCREFDEGNG